VSFLPQQTDDTKQEEKMSDFVPLFLEEDELKSKKSLSGSSAEPAKKRMRLSMTSSISGKSASNQKKKP
jgi:hypothetical protein